MHKKHNSNFSMFGVIPLCLFKYFHACSEIDFSKKKKKPAATEMQLQSNIWEVPCTRAICLPSV